ncbi:MAG: glycerol-3-phosphate dehydrogenase/oxidase [Desulfobacteraceae bacterium]|nr:glycerol-3-phosphate dehydrogenase/oxidase [Desulfobacteraceae bacterium]
MEISDTQETFDLVVIGGGVTGAGVFNTASKMGIKTLLLEGRDFAWGTSSRTSKMVHGGLRYLKQGRFFLTRAAVKEREKLLKTYAGLVNPLDFVMPVFKDFGPSMVSMNIGLSIYSIMAKEKQHREYSKEQTIKLIPQIRQKYLTGSMGFKDAQVDDARLVLRLINDGCMAKGRAYNYTKVTRIKRNARGDVSAVQVVDTVANKEIEVKTRAVINATGAWAEELHPIMRKNLHIRPQRGSHMAFPREKFPLDRVISFFHPGDLRPIYVFPWNGCTFLGTTDVDHDHSMDSEPFMSEKEAGYLMEGLAYVLPEIKLASSDSIASIAGIRPIISHKKKAKNASGESREHMVWEDKGLITVAGGKLTTFHILVKDALKAAKKYLPGQGKLKEKKKIVQDTIQDQLQDLPQSMGHRLLGRYGHAVSKMVLENKKEDFSYIGETQTLWAEICHGAKNEKITNLSDLMLRRVRLGLVLPHGGKALLDDIQKKCAPHLCWDEKRWETEKEEYIRFWETYYSPPHARG